MNSRVPEIDSTEKDILQAIKNGDRTVFVRIYDQYANDLLNYIYRFTKDKQVSEDILQEIFIDIWNRRENLDVRISFRNYLFVSAKYAILSYIRSEKVRQKYADHFALFLAQHGTDSTSAITDLNDLNSIILQVIDKLPNKCREAFFKSRYQNKTIQEIALEMNISTRTVENYITTGIKTIRIALENYSWLLLIFYTLNQDLHEYF